MTNETKVVVASKDGTALIGKHFHQLVNDTMLSFKTKDPAALRKYIAKMKYLEDEIIITHDDTTIQIIPVDPQFNDDVIGVCHMTESPVVNMVRGAFTELPVGQFEKLLYTLRKFYGLDGKVLYDQVRDLNVQKVTKIERKADNQGNYHLCVTRSGGRGDMEPTATLRIRIPVFESSDCAFEVDFDVHMGYREVDGGGVTIGYSLVNPFFEEELRDRKKAIIADVLTNFPVSVDSIIYGSAILLKKTNSWMFQENGLN